MGALFMFDLSLLLKPPLVFLMLGVISISASVVWTLTGRVWVRFHGWVYRAKEPGSFWWEVILYFLCGVGLIVYFLSKV
jgi:hypothetical protein